MIERELRGSVALMTMSHGRANALDLDLLPAISDALVREADEETDAVVLAGTGRIFSAGVDLHRFVAGGPPYIAELIPTLTRCLRTVFTFPKPIVAAVNGHAIAAGCLLALATDYRIMAEDSGRVGVPELDFGVPFPSILLELLRFTIPRQHQHEVIFHGGTYQSTQALEYGLVDELVPAHSLLHRAVQEAQRLGKIPCDIYEVTKAQLRQTAVAAIDISEDLYDERVLQILARPDTLDTIQDYMDRTVGKREPSAVR